jgi:hypothetical protein
MGTGMKSALVAIDTPNAVSRQLTRREMMQRLLVGAVAGAASPMVAASHPFFGHLENATVLEETENLAAVNWKPLFLSAQQNEGLIAIAESIVPGSTKAQVNRFIDLLLSVDSGEHKKSFIDSLAAFEAESQKRFAKSFPSLDGGQKNTFLTDASASAERETSDSAAAKLHGLSEHFENLKGWISGAYYSSEVGMRELGWTGDYAFAGFPGCEHPEGHT